MRAVGVMLAIVLAVASASAVQAPSPASAAICSDSDVARTSVRVDASRARLLALPVADMNTDVSTTAQKAIADMKDSLEAFIQAYVRCAGAQPDAAAVKTGLSSTTHAFQIPIDQPQYQPSADFGKYGFEIFFDVRVFDSPRLIGVTAEFSIQCGHDTVLLLFAPNGDSWNEILRWQKKPYKTVAGGTMAFNYDVSPPDKEGRWFVVAHDIAPWCSSTWSTIRHSVLRPNTGSQHPQTLFSGSDEIWCGSEDFGSLTLEKDAFDLRFHAWSVDPGVHNRVWIRHYSIIGDVVRRTQPVAVTPRDFVDEWMVSPWTQAESWTSRTALAKLRQSHADWAEKSKATDGLLEFQSVRRCSDRRDHFQVEVGEWYGRKLDRSRSFFFHVRGDRDYTMLQILRQPHRKCQGPDLLDEMRTR